MTREQHTEEVEHDPGFIVVLMASIDGLWSEGPWYRLALMLLTGVALTAVTAFIAVLALGVLPL